MFFFLMFQVNTENFDNIIAENLIYSLNWIYWLKMLTYVSFFLR